MRKQLWMIAKVWAFRPTMWLVTIVTAIAVLASLDGRNRIVLRSAFVIPGEYGATGAVRLAPMSTLKNGEEFQRSAQSGEVDRSVEGIDLKSMDLRDSTNPLEDLSSLEHGLANYPSVRWIRFGKDQIQHVSHGTLSRLANLVAVIIHDNQIVAIIQYVCFHTLNSENILRTAIVFAASTIAGTGLVLWGSSIRNIFAVGLFVAVGLSVVTFASLSCLDVRWIDHGERGDQIHAFVTSPLFYAVSFAAAGLILWTGYYRLSHCELSRQ